MDASARGYEVIRLPMVNGHATAIRRLPHGFVLPTEPYGAGRRRGEQRRSLFVSDDGSRSIWHVSLWWEVSSPS